MTRFLKHFPGFYVQTFDDKGINKSLTTHGTPKNYTKEKLQKLNEAGAGIFFTPNKFSTQRKKELCEGINAWFMEIDDVDIDTQWKRVVNGPLMPSIVVKTQKSLHSYFLAKDASKGQFLAIQKGLISYYGADPACKDITRVLRIPGFYHNKKDPHMVEVVWDKGNKYSEEEMLRHYKYKAPTHNIWDHIGNLDNKEILRRLSGQSIVNNEIISFKPRSPEGEYILVDEKPSDAWLDGNGMIGSGKGGGPTFVQWLDYYGRSKGEIAKWVKENCKDLLPKEVYVINPKGTPANEIDVNKTLNEKYDLTWGTKTLDDAFPPLGRGKYGVLVGATGTGKTAWALDMALKNAGLRRKVLYISLEMTKASLVVRYARTKLNITKKQWREKAYDSQKIRECISSMPKLGIKDTADMLDTSLKSIKEIVRKGDYDLVFLDNFGFVESPIQNMNERMQAISRAMVDLTNESNTTIIALHHFRKESSDDSKKHGLNSIMGSAKISHDADFVLKVSRQTDVEIDEEQADFKQASLMVTLMKDRDFGDLQSQIIFFQNGTFNSIFNQDT